VGSLDDLLAVQALDTRADQLRHRRDTLPERTELADARTRRDAGEARAAEVRARLKDLRHRQKALEDEASSVEDHAAEVERKLYDGSVVAHKELEAFQADHRMLKARQSELEDGAIEVMEQAEPVEDELDALDAAVAEQQAEIDRLELAVAGAEAQLDAELVDTLADRDAAAAGLPADVIEAYEPLRRQLGGVGAARLLGARCEGCHLEIPSAQLEAVRKAPPEAIVTCPECGRLLVR
jgi:predicted  nucleic acid-binding Zn-ribbon protein